MSSRSNRLTGLALTGALLTAFVLPASVGAAEAQATDVEFFYRYEQVATANWTTTQDCGDGTTSETLVSVIGGLEFETPDLGDVNRFVTVRLLSFETCDGELLSETLTGTGAYTGSHTLRRARITGVLALDNGDKVNVRVRWTGHGPIDKDVNVTKFPGFRGVFTSREREATAHGRVVIDGINLIEGQPSDRGSIETLEDKNITFSTGA